MSHVAEILQTEPNQKSSAIPPTHWLTLVLTLVTFKKTKAKNPQQNSNIKRFSMSEFLF